MPLPKPDECLGCPLYSLGSGFSVPTGECTTGVMLMGEALGATEAQKGVPFVGDAGAQLNRTLSRTPYTRKDFRLYNVLQCQPPKNWLVGAPWEQGAIDHCAVHRHRILKETRPKAVVALGGTALEALIGKGEILKRRGYVYSVPIIGVDDFVEWSLGFNWVVGTYHPSYLMQGNQNLTGIQVFDILRAVEVAKNGWKWQEHERYVELPSLDAVDEFINKAIVALGAGAWLTADIETARSTTVDEDERSEINDPITRISFAFEPGYAISIPWSPDYLTRIQDLLNLPRTCLAFWNADFDVPRLKAHGMTIRPKIVDSMYMWHFLQSDLPKSLGFVATLYTKMAEWKSLATQSPTFYSCCDADAQIQCTLGIRRDLERQGRFDRFMRHHTELQPILTEMGQSGVLLDMKKREEFRSAIEEDRKKIDGEIQAAVPENLRPLKPRRKVPGTANLGDVVKPSDPQCLWDYDRETGEWGERHPFLYNSSHQVLKYIRSQGHTVPRNYKTGKDTTGKDDLESLARRYPKDPVYRKIIEARELHKVIGQYIDGYRPSPSGRVLTTFTQKPSTWRLASEGPNVQNVRRRWHLANRYREQFVAAPGHVLVEADYRAIEAVLTGFYAQDATYVRAAKLGVHSILAAHILSHPIRDIWSEPLRENEVLDGIRDIKKCFKDVYDKAKTIVHLSNYKGSSRRIKIEYPELFNSVAEAEKLQRLYFSTIATKVEAWHGKVVALAAGQSYLDNVFGYRHYFYDVLRYDGTYGTDAKKALAFLPQSTAAAIIKEAILRLAAKDVYRRAMRWQIHDALLFELPNDRLLDSRIRTIVEEMTRPIPELDGLVIDVEVKVGENWGMMKEWP